MNRFVIGILVAGVGCNLRAATNSTVTAPAAANAAASESNSVIEKEYRKLIEDDDAAQTEVDRWIKENKAAVESEKAGLDFTVRARVSQRLDRVREAYEEFIRKHPEHVHARVAFASFLDDIGDEESSLAQLERARELDPKDPAIWNNLANYFGHHSPVKKAFEYYGKAIELSPEQPVYYQNLATSVFLFRKDAMEYYNLTEVQVFDRALELYRKALKLDPQNFVLASDYAQTFYGIRPLRNDDAIAAWEYALNTARDEEQREGVRIHIARVKLAMGRLDEARQQLNAVTNQVYAELKERVSKNIEEREKEKASTSQSPAEPKAEK